MLTEAEADNFRRKIQQMEDVDTLLTVLIEYQGLYILPDLFDTKIHPQVQKNIVSKLISNMNQRNGRKLFAISKEWLDSWDFYVSNPDYKPRPGIICNQ